MLIEIKKTVNETVEIKDGTYYRKFYQDFAKIIIQGELVNGAVVHPLAICGFVIKLELRDYFGENSQEITEQEFNQILNERMQWITKI